MRFLVRPLPGATEEIEPSCTQHLKHKPLRVQYIPIPSFAEGRCLVSRDHTHRDLPNYVYVGDRSQEPTCPQAHRKFNWAQVFCKAAKVARKGCQKSSCALWRNTMLPEFILANGHPVLTFTKAVYGTWPNFWISSKEVAVVSHLPVPSSAHPSIYLADLRALNCFLCDSELSAPWHHNRDCSQAHR